MRTLHGGCVFVLLAASLSISRNQLSLAGQPLQCPQDSRCQSIRHPEPQRALSSDPAPGWLRLPPPSPFPSRLIPGWGGLTLSPMGTVRASSLVSWEGCPRWREGDRVCWGRGGSLLWCCLPHLWPLRPPAWIPRIWHQRPPSLGGLQPCPQQCVWKAEALTPAAHPAPASSLRAPTPSSGGGLLFHASPAEAPA